MDQMIMDVQETLDSIAFDLLVTELRMEEAFEELAASTEERVLESVDTLNRSNVLIRDLQAHQELAKRELELRNYEHYLFLVALHQDAERLQECLNILEAEAWAMEIECGLVQTVYHAEVAEAERIRREEKDARCRAARGASSRTSGKACPLEQF